MNSSASSEEEEVDELFEEDEEFYATHLRHTRRRKKSRAQVEEERTYGIFAPSRSSRSNDIGFVTATTSSPSKPASESSSGEKEDEMKATFHNLLREGGGKVKTNQDFAQLVQEQPPPKEEEYQPPTAHLKQVNIQKLGHWEKHTKGFGMKMMLKMGFKGRLGKHEQGISKPVAVKVRPNQLGLGFGQFREAANLKQNKEIESELHGKELEDETPTEKVVQMTDEGFWKKTSRKKPQRIYKTADQVIREQQQQPQVIIDMRGPKRKVLNDMNEANAPQQTTPPGFGQELMYNVKLLVELAQTKVHETSCQVQRCESTKTTLEQEREFLHKKTSAEREKLDKITKILGAIEAIESQMNHEDLSFSEIMTKLIHLRTSCEQEFQYYQLQNLIPALALPALKKSLEHWNPLLDDNECVIDELKLLKKGLLWHSSLASGRVETSPLMEVFDPEELAPESRQLFDQVVQASVMTPLRRVLMTEWNVRDSAICVHLIAALRGVLTSTLINKILNEIIYPRLRKACDNWDPKNDSVPIQDWVLPWKDLLGESMTKLYDSIRKTLTKAFAAWKPEDASALAVVSPWHGIWAEKSFDTFITRSILPKLISSLRQNFRVNPAKQELDPLLHVLRWVDLVPLPMFVSLLEGEVFSVWIEALRHWLVNSPNFDELVTWYLGWKSVFPEKIVLDVRIRRKFNIALHLMDKAASNEPISVTRITPSSYYDAHEAYQRGQWNSKSSVKPTAPNPSKFNVPFKEIVAQFAIDQNILYVPHPRQQTYEGKPIFVFGGINTVIEQGVLFADDSKGQYHPISLEDLVAKVR